MRAVAVLNGANYELRQHSPPDLQAGRSAAALQLLTSGP
jgi:hypothetical protein